MGDNKFFKNVSWLVGGKIVNMILQFVVSLATARYLGPSNFGTINYVAAFVSFFSSIASLGLSVIVIKEIAGGAKNRNEIIWTSIMLRLFTAIFSTISILGLMYIMHGNEEDILIIAFLESLSIIFSSFDTINYYFQARLMSKWTAIAGVLAYMGMSLYRIYLLAVEADVVWFALASSADMIFLTIFLMIFYIRQEGFRIQFNILLGKSLIKQSYHYMIAGLIAIIYAQIDRVMLGNMVSKHSVGLYSAALTISALWSMIPTAINQSICPVLYKAAKENKDLYYRRLSQAYAVLFWLNASYSIFCTIFSKFIINILYGAEYIEAAGVLSIVVWYYGISTMSTLHQVYLANENISKYINVWCAVGLGVDVILNICLIPLCGIVGAGIATLITQLVIQILLPLLTPQTRPLGRVIWRGISLRGVFEKEDFKIFLNLIKK